VNEAKDAFVAAEVKKALKNNDVEVDTSKVLKKAQKLITEEKELKKKVKDEGKALHLLTKETIEKLSDKEAIELIKQKWILSLVMEINELPNVVVSDFVKKLEVLCSKYEITFAEVEQQICDTEASLISLLDELTGSEFDMKGIEELKVLLSGE